MSHSDQRAVRAAPEKVTARETRRVGASTAGGEIRGSRCGAVAGMSLHAPMT